MRRMLYVCACVYVCMHLRVYGCMCVCVYACMHVSVYACTRVRVYVCMHVSVYACMCVCVYACVDPNTLVNMHAVIHKDDVQSARLRPHIHTYTHRYSIMSSPVGRPDPYFLNFFCHFIFIFNRYSIMSSPVGRPDPTSVIKMHDGQYNTDALNKASVAHVAQDRQNSRAFKVCFFLLFFLLVFSRARASNLIESNPI